MVDVIEVFSQYPLWFPVDIQKRKMFVLCAYKGGLLMIELPLAVSGRMRVYKPIKGMS